MTQVFRIGFALAMMALASASAHSDSATAGSLSATRDQASRAQAALVDKVDVVARNGEGTQSELRGASRYTPSGANSGPRSATSRLAPEDNLPAAKWSYIESLKEFIGLEGGSP